MKPLKKAGFALIAVVLALLFLEGILRILNAASDDLSHWMRFHNPHRNDSSMIQDPILFWRSRPGPLYGVNEEGIRGRPVDVKKPADTFRVLCLGDSSTFGVNVSLEETYSFQLEGILSERYEKKIEVMNAGVSGYSSYQGMKALETRYAAFRPDLVIAYFGIHDMAEAIFFEDKNQTLVHPLGVRADRLLGGSKVYQVLAKLVRRAKGMRPGSILDPSIALTRVSPKDSFDNHLRMERLAAAWGGTLLVVPAVVVNPDFGSCNLNLASMDEFEKRFHVLDLCPAFDEADIRNMTFFDSGGVHPNAEGYGIYARRMAAWIAENEGLLGLGSNRP